MPSGIYKHKSLSEETKRKISEHHKLNGVGKWMAGRRLTTEQKIIRSGNWSGGMTGKHHSKETREKLKNKNYGKKLSDETKLKMSNSRKGSKSYNWKGGITPINKIIRHSFEYKLWIKAVFERDKYTCQWCGNKNGNGKTITLNAHHIKSFAKYPELRFAIDNGITLCVECHKKTFNN